MKEPYKFRPKAWIYLSTLDLTLASDHRKSGVNLEYLLWNQLRLSEFMLLNPRAEFNSRAQSQLYRARDIWSGCRGERLWQLPSFSPQEVMSGYSADPFGHQTSWEIARLSSEWKLWERDSWRLFQKAQGRWPPPKNAVLVVGLLFQGCCYLHSILILFVI